MRIDVRVLCDGCENFISDPSKAWEWNGVVRDMVVVVHPNNRCAKAAERRLGVVLR